MGIDELFIKAAILAKGDKVDIRLRIAGTTRESYTDYEVRTCRTGTFTERKTERVLQRIEEAYECF